MLIVPLLVLAACEDETTPLAASSTTTLRTSTPTTAAPVTATTAPSPPEERGKRFRGTLLRRTDSGMTIDGRARPDVTRVASGLMQGNPPDYVLEAVRDAAGVMIWFGRFEGAKSGDAPPPIRIIDTLDVPAHPTDQHVQITGCGPRGQGTAPEVFALVKIVPGSPTYPVVQAWRASRTSQEITAVPPDQIECENVGYGA